MASTVLPNGIIIPEKYSRDWYNDLYHNWQELDNLLGGGTPKDGTLTIQKNGSTVGTFSANQATNETVNIEVPTVNDATLTIQRNGTTVDTFTANSSTDKTVNIAIPTKTSDLTNDSNFVPSTDLATVATSGNYNDLSNKPTIPTVNNATLTIQKNGTNVQTFTANQSTNATANITVPTKTSDLTNDSGFITSDNTKIPLAGSNQISGSLIPATTNTYNLGSPSSQWNNTYTRNILIDNDINIASSLINKTSTSGVISIRGGLNTQDGASIGLYGKDYNGGIAGNIYMTAYGNSDYTNFRIYPNGTISVYNNSRDTTKNVAMQEDVIPRSGGAVFNGNTYTRFNSDGTLFFCSGINTNTGAYIGMYGATSTDLYGRGDITIGVNADGAFNFMSLKHDGTWTWTGTAVQLVSDQRLKQQITKIDDKLLDAWEDVTLVQFKYNDAVNKKGDNARLHTGFVVQQIDDACKSHNVDISDYGLYCHEEYPEETEEVEVEQADGTKVKERKVIREASEHYSLRYTEVYAVECMYLRRCIARLTARIEELEKENKGVEK